MTGPTWRPSKECLENIELARMAYVAASEDRWDEATDLMILINMACTAEMNTIANAVMVWADTLRAHMLDGHTGDLELMSSAISTDDGDYVIGSARADTELAPAMLWASDIIDARITRNFEKFMDLWNSAPDGEGFGDYVMHVLTFVVCTIRATEPGAAIRGE